ncbi:hypothetical protein T484DRAFT_1916552, partial [Baffinella frigidus]
MVRARARPLPGDLPGRPEDEVPLDRFRPGVLDPSIRGTRRHSLLNDRASGGASPSSPVELSNSPVLSFHKPVQVVLPAAVLAAVQLSPPSVSQWAPSPHPERPLQLGASSAAAHSPRASPVETQWSVAEAAGVVPSEGSALSSSRSSTASSPTSLRARGGIKAAKAWKRNQARPTEGGEAPGAAGEGAGGRTFEYLSADLVRRGSVTAWEALEDSLKAQGHLCADEQVVLLNEELRLAQSGHHLEVERLGGEIRHLRGLAGKLKEQRDEAEAQLHTARAARDSALAASDAIRAALQSHARRARDLDRVLGVLGAWRARCLLFARVRCKRNAERALETREALAVWADRRAGRSLETREALAVWADVAAQARRGKAVEHERNARRARDVRRVRGVLGAWRARCLLVARVRFKRRAGRALETREALAVWADVAAQARRWKAVESEVEREVSRRVAQGGEERRLEEEIRRVEASLVSRRSPSPRPMTPSGSKSPRHSPRLSSIDDNREDWGTAA